MQQCGPVPTHRASATAQVGIQPDVALAPDAMPPTDGPGFCRYVASADAPALFGPARAAPALMTRAAQGAAAAPASAS